MSVAKEELDFETVHKRAEDLLQPVEVLPEGKTRLPSGRKKTTLQRNKAVQPPLRNTPLKYSEILRTLVADRFKGVTVSKTAESLGIDQSTLSRIAIRYADGYEHAKQEHLARCLQEYQTNLWLMRGALSEWGPAAVSTLGEIMSDKKAAYGVRRQAAVDILKLCNVDGASGVGNEEVAAKLKVLLDENLNVLEDDAYILDAPEVQDAVD